MKKLSNRLLAAVGFFAFLFLFAVIPGADAQAATLKSGKVVGPIKATYAGEMHTLKVSKTGYASFAVGSAYTQVDEKYAQANVTIYKGKTQLIYSKRINFMAANENERTLFCALKPGTYKLKVNMVYPSVTGYNSAGQFVQVQNQYSVSTVVRATKNQGGASKKKAVTIKLKSQKTGIVALTDKASSTYGSVGTWYKFKLTKKTSVKLRVVANTTNNAGQKSTLSFIVSGRAPQSSLRNLVDGKTVKLPKGTYYIKIYKANKYDSGYYKISLNKTIK